MKKRNKRTKLIIIALLVILLIASLYLFYTHQQSDKYKLTVIPVTSTPKSNIEQNSDKQTTTTNQSPTSSKTTDSSTASNQQLIAPRGQFISNHHPNISGTPAPSSENSVCITTPGASCQITFSKGGETKSLPIKTADSNGNVSWDWDINNAGFTVGNWQVTAISTLNGQKLTANDSMLLEVSQ